MPNKCVRCGNVYEKEQFDSNNFGCSCGSQLFFYVKTLDEPVQEKIKKPKKRTKKLNEKMKFRGKVETIHAKSPGVYEINLEALLKERPIIVHEKGDKKYIIDLKSLFKAF